MFSFDQLVAAHDALKAKGGDTKVLDMLDSYIVKDEEKSDAAMKKLLDRQAKVRAGVK